jgi:general secretion pathway protein E
MPTVRLVCTAGPAAPIDIEGETITIGRHKTNTIPLPGDDIASRFHCTVEPNSRGPIVRDLGSRNGTKVNGERVARHVLASGDVLKVGRHIFTVELAGGVVANGSHADGREQNAETPVVDTQDTDPPAMPATPAEREAAQFEALAAIFEEGDELARAAAVPAGPGPDAPLPLDDDDAHGSNGTGSAGPNPSGPTAVTEQEQAGDEPLPLAPSREDGVDRPRRAHSPRRASASVGSERAAEVLASGRPRWAEELAATIKELDAKHTSGSQAQLFNADGSPSAALEGKGGGSVAVKMLLLLAARARATDIHMEPKRDAILVRVRIDGTMVHITDMPMKVGEAALGLVKTACQFPQTARDQVLDGHCSADVAGERVDYRASFTPTVHGRKLVLRVLDPRNAPQNINELMLPHEVQRRVERLCESDAGMLLAAGPTGSGKTTTLYNCLRFIDRGARNVVTIEDPVEYAIDQTTQIPVSEKQRFGTMLRSVLRQDPDVILVGEIRDSETARTASEAAMTGHVVFTTIHAKDSFSAVFRLLDLGVDNTLVANSLELVIAQRLVKRLCEDCKRAVRITPGQTSKMGKFLRGADEVYVATGCAKCLRTGYKGRRGLYELLDVSDDLRDVILKNPNHGDLKRTVSQTNFRTLQQAGWELAAKGLTSLDEVDRVAGGGG